jgi:spheroidene monooxygenase
MSALVQVQTAAALSGVVVVLLLDFADQHRAWGWLRLAQGSAAFRGVPGLQFSKIMGSGHGGGFGLRPSSTHQGLVLLFDSLRSARAFCISTDLLAFVSRAREHWLGTLAVTSVRGQWDQQSWSATSPACLGVEPPNPSPEDPTPALAELPVAVLTRGSIRPAKAMSFWRYSPAAQADLGQAAGCQLAMGLGEAPLVRQCTFSLWDDTAAMVAYAHQGAHRQAIVAAQRHDFFSESMFARLRVLSMSGTWRGRHYGEAADRPACAPANLPPPIREVAHV